MKLELLAPAGSFEMLKTAIYYGADAVYFGLDGCNAREKAESCSIDSVSEWITLCHIHGVRAYLAANILIKEKELSGVLQKIERALRYGADAFIIQDAGLIQEVNRLFPEAAVHVSTQAGVGNVRAVSELKERLHFQRVVLARECGKREIGQIVKNGIETEVFVHGALCVAYSGNCYFSSMLTGNSGNRGRCQQFCRTRFLAKDRKQSKNGYFLSPKDLCLARQISDLSELGVTSVKIEGRMRRAEYVAETVRIYRKAIDGECVAEQDIERLKAVFNRGNYTTGHFTSSSTNALLYPSAPGHIGLSDGLIANASGRTATLSAKRPPHVGDGFKLFSHGSECGSGVCVKTEGNNAILSVSENVESGCEARLTTDAARNAALMDFTLNRPIDIFFTARAGERAELKLSFGEKSAVCSSPESVQHSVTCPTSTDTVTRQLVKLTETGFSAGTINLNVDDGVFLPVSLLNAMRREAIEQLNLNVTAGSPIRSKMAEVARNSGVEDEKRDKTSRIAVILSDFRQLHSTMRDKIDEIILEPTEFDETTLQAYGEIAAKSFLSLPYFLAEEDVQFVKPYLNYFKGVYCSNPYAVRLARELGKEIFLGEMNLTNASAVSVWAQSGIERISLSKELNIREAREASKASAAKRLLYLPLFGRTKCMQLTHCPAQLLSGCNCAHCAYSANLTLTDRNGKVFPVRRFRAKNCYFFVLNSAVQNGLADGAPEGFSYLLELQESSPNQMEEVVQALRENRAYSVIGDWTRGHLARGVK